MTGQGALFSRLNLAAMVALVVMFAGSVAPGVRGWVLGARSNPFAELSRAGAAGGQEDFRLADFDGGPASSLGLLGTHGRHVGSSLGSREYSKRSPEDEQPIRLCGDMLDKVIRFTCRNYWDRIRGKRSVGSVITDWDEDDYKVRSRGKRQAGASDICCARPCRRSEIIQFCN